MGTLSLDFHPVFIPKSITQFLVQVSKIGSVTEKVLQVNDFINRLESETRKIEAFKRELPLCMLLINDAIAALKEESMVLKNSSNIQPVLEEFLPLKNNFHDDDDGKVETVINQEDSGDKKNWLSSTHLWNTDECLDQMVKKTTEEEDVWRAIVNENNGLISSFTPDIQRNIQTDNTELAPPQQQTLRKRRRCWSTELHRRFINALQELGGSQVATPKQILELMKVDGLTSDEVKSHLQKYRLHTRRVRLSKVNEWMSKFSRVNSGSPDQISNNVDDEDEKSENYCGSGNL